MTYPKEVIGPGFYNLYIGFDMPFEDDDGNRISLFVKDLTSTAVTFTINHPLAGQATINAIRPLKRNLIYGIATGSSLSLE